MKIVNTIQERDQIKTAILCKKLSDGTWQIYEIGDEHLIPVVAKESSWVISPEEFRKRFTQVQIDKILDLAFIKADVKVQNFIFNLSTSSDGINLKSNKIMNAMDYLIVKLIITEQDKQAILTL